MTRRIVVSATILAICLVVPAWAADPLPYTVKIDPTGVAGLDAAMTGSAQLVGLRKRAPAGPFAVVARARQDIPRLKTALDSFGYYAGRVTVTIGGAGLDDPDLQARLTAAPASPPVAIAVHVDRGPLFHLRRVTLDGAVPESGRRAFTLRPGQPAVAADVLGTGGAVLTALREDGYALAQVDPPLAVLVPAQDALDVSFHVPGRPARRYRPDRTGQSGAGSTPASCAANCWSIPATCSSPARSRRRVRIWPVSACFPASWCAPRPRWTARATFR